MTRKKREKSARQSRALVLVERPAWYDQRAVLLQTACANIAASLQSGETLQCAIRAAAHGFRGRSLGGGRRLKLSPKTLQNIWYDSDGGRLTGAFEVGYRNTERAAVRRLSSLAERYGRLIGWLRTVQLSFTHQILVAHVERSIRIALLRLALIDRQQYDLQRRISTRPIRSRPGVCNKIKSLSGKQRQQLHCWFRQNLSYRDIAKNVRREFGLEISCTTLCTYYRRRRCEILEISPASSAIQWRKPRVRENIDLSGEQQTQLWRWVRNGLTDRQVADNVRRTFGLQIRPTSLGLYRALHHEDILGLASA